MIFTLILLSLLSFGTGYAVHKAIHLKEKNPEPPVLDTPDNVLCYLEACTDLHNPEMNELFNEFRLFVNQKQLPAISVTSTIQEKPQWYHSNDAAMTPEEHWNIFWEEVASEESQTSKLDVIKTWLELNVKFTTKERQLMLAQFDEKHRTMVRKLFVKKKKKKKKANG